jgi:hypothetical protein
MTLNQRWYTEVGIIIIIIITSSHSSMAFRIGLRNKEVTTILYL